MNVLEKGVPRSEAAGYQPKSATEIVEMHQARKRRKPYLWRWGQLIQMRRRLKARIKSEKAKAKYEALLKPETIQALKDIEQPLFDIHVTLANLQNAKVEYRAEAVNLLIDSFGKEWALRWHEHTVRELDRVLNKAIGSLLEKVQREKQAEAEKEGDQQNAAGVDEL